MSWDPSGGLAAHVERQAQTAVHPTLRSTAPVWAALVTVVGCSLAIVGTLIPWAKATARTRFGDVFGGLGGDLVVALNTGTIDGWDTTVGKLILVAAVALVLCVQALVLLPRHRTATMSIAAVLAVVLVGCGVWAGVSVVEGGSTRDELLEILRSRDIFSQFGIEAKDPATSASEGAVITVIGCALAGAGAIAGVLSLMIGRAGVTRRDPFVA
jgi:hypothetical protein